MKKLLLFLVLMNLNSIHAIPIESHPLKNDSRLQNQPQEPSIIRKSFDLNTINSYWNINSFERDKTVLFNATLDNLSRNSKLSFSYVVDNSLAEDACSDIIISISGRSQQIIDNEHLTSGFINYNNDKQKKITGLISQNGDNSFLIYLSPLEFDYKFYATDEIRINFNETGEMVFPFYNGTDQISENSKKCKEYYQQELGKRNRAKAEVEIARINKLNKETQEKYLAQMKKPDVKIGMTKQQVLKNTRWGAPINVHSTTTANGTAEQWVYWGYKYLYFMNGKLTMIQK